MISFSTKQEGVTAQQQQEQRAKQSFGVDLDALSGKMLWLQFAAFGFYERVCQLELKENGDCLFTKGMVTDGPGAWRVEVRLARTPRNAFGRNCTAL